MKYVYKKKEYKGSKTVLFGVFCLGLFCGYTLYFHLSYNLCNQNIQNEYPEGKFQFSVNGIDRFNSNRGGFNQKTTTVIIETEKNEIIGLDEPRALRLELETNDDEHALEGGEMQPDKSVEIFIAEIESSNLLDSVRLKWLNDEKVQNVRLPDIGDNNIPILIVSAGINYQYDEDSDLFIDIFAVRRRAFGKGAGYFQVELDKQFQQWKSFDESTILENPMEQNLFCAILLGNGSFVLIPILHVPFLAGDSGNVIDILRCPIHQYLTRTHLAFLSHSLVQKYSADFVCNPENSQIIDHSQNEISLDVAFLRCSKGTVDCFKGDLNSQNIVKLIRIPLSTRSSPGIFYFSNACGTSASSFYSFGLKTIPVLETQKSKSQIIEKIDKNLVVVTRIQQFNKHFIEWITYHILIGTAHVFVGIHRPKDSDDFKKWVEALTPFVQKGFVSFSCTFVEGYTQGVFPVQEYFETIALYHSKGISKWIGMWDPDEFPMVHHQQDAPFNLVNFVNGVEKNNVLNGVQYPLCSVTFLSVGVVEDARNTVSFNDPLLLLGDKFSLREAQGGLIWRKTIGRTRFVFYGWVHLINGGCSLDWDRNWKTETTAGSVHEPWEQQIETRWSTWTWEKVESRHAVTISDSIGAMMHFTNLWRSRDTIDPSRLIMSEYSLMNWKGWIKKALEDYYGADNFVKIAMNDNKVFLI